LIAALESAARNAAPQVIAPVVGMIGRVWCPFKDIKNLISGAMRSVVTELPERRLISRPEGRRRRV